MNDRDETTHEPLDPEVAEALDTLRRYFPPDVQRAIFVLVEAGAEDVGEKFAKVEAEVAELRDERARATGAAPITVRRVSFFAWLRSVVGGFWRKRHAAR